MSILNPQITQTTPPLPRAVATGVKDPRKPFEPTWPSLQNHQVPKWYLDAKFGIFIHWGVASVPAFQSEWYPKWMYVKDKQPYQHHLDTYGPHKQFGYKDFIPRFTMDRFDPQAWAQLFKDAGAKYVVPVAEHHDGFAMYDYNGSEWTSLKMGPKRDLIGELAEAVRHHDDLHFCVSSHRAYNWRFFSYDDAFDTVDPENIGLYGRPHGPDEPADEAFLENWLERTCELVDKYQPELVWFDWCIGWPEFEPYRRKFAAHYYNRAVQWGQDVTINYKEQDFAPGAGVWDLERGQLDELRGDYWQTDTAVCRKSWCYIDEPDYKPARSLIHDLVDIVSKNGCMLLNIGPRPDGTIPDQQQQILLDIGAWLKVHGEAIYHTRPWKVFGEGPTRIKTGTFQEKVGHDFTAKDIRFTQNGDVVYATVLGVPDDGKVLIRSMASGLRLIPGSLDTVRLLGHDDAVDWTQAEDGLHVQLPKTPPSEVAVVLKVNTKPLEAPLTTAQAAGDDTPEDDLHA